MPKTKQEVYKEFAKLIQKWIPKNDWNFLWYVERNDIYDLDSLFSRRTYWGSYMYDWNNWNELFQKQLQEWHNRFVKTWKNITLKEIELFLK